MEKVALDARAIAQRLFDRQDFETCEQVLFEHLKVNRLDVESYVLLAEIYEKLYRPELALQNYTSALTIAETQGEDVAELNKTIERMQKEAEIHADRNSAISEKSKQQTEAHQESGSPHESPQAEFDATIKVSRQIFPYLGFAEKQSTTMLSNDYGFRLVDGFKGTSLPYLRTSPDEFIVGIFGGSIASAFYQDSVGVLTELLGNHPGLTGREITVLNFAMSGSKQPEPLIALAYFTGIGQQFDLIINIDGLNDLAGCSSNMHAGHHIGMPPADITNVFTTLTELPALNPEALQYFLRIAKLDKTINRWEKGALSFLDGLGISGRLKKKRARLMADKPSSNPDDNLIHVHRTDVIKMELLNDEKFDAALNQITDFWERCVKNMIHICAGLNITYIHSFHPSHFLMKNSLRPVDQNIVEQASVDYYRRLVTIGFPKFAAVAEDFAADANNAAFCSLNEVMDELDGDLLEDAVAHLKPRVHIAMAEKLADFINRQPLE